MTKSNLNRFFVLPENIYDNKLRISGTDVKHIKTVLRLKEGDEIIIFDGTGNEYIAVIDSLDDELNCTIKDKRDIENPKCAGITLLQGVPKGSKMDYVVQKCTETGVNDIIPLITERTVVKLDDKRKIAKKNRWQKIAKSSAQQSKSSIVPIIHEPVSLDEALDIVREHSLKLIAWESEYITSLRDILKKHHASLISPDSSIAICIGPEGGFSYQEVDKAKSKGMIPVSLGSRILRSESAGFATCVMILYELDAMG
ncbi:MAG: 16S rRNA (uracil(1498)-N(3))-methyltransferase [bacterium]